MQTASACNVQHVEELDKVLTKNLQDADAQGLMVEEETVSVKIPAGVVDGMQLKVYRKRKRSTRKWYFRRSS